MKPGSYKLVIAGMATLCIVLTAAVVYLLAARNHSMTAMQTMAEDPVIAKGPSSVETGANKPHTQTSGPDPALAPVQLSAQRMQAIGVTKAVATVKDLASAIQAPGNVEINEEKLASVQTRFPGWIQKVFASATWQYVRKGQPLFTIYSPDLVSSQQEYLLARKTQNAFSQTSHSDSMPGMDHSESGWMVQAATQRLEQFGVAPEEIANLEKTGKEQRYLTVYSPVSGFITERAALPNTYVQPETKLYTIADLNTVWVYANVSQNDVGRIRPGERAEVVLDAYPGKTFSARVDQILPQLDQATRTVRVRLVMANSTLALKPGMLVNVTISAKLGRQLVVPSSAILHSGQRSVAFLDRGEGGMEPRTVTTGPQVDGDIVILAGLKAGDRVVSSANFLIDSEAQLQAASQNFTTPPTESSANSEKATENISINLSTVPDPPRVGSNSVHVRLTGPDGKPVSGSQVKLVLFMPAMPQMGMAAMRSEASLADRGAGVYEGNADFPMAGTWQVTVQVMRAGQLVASRKLSATAGGGM